MKRSNAIRKLPTKSKCSPKRSPKILKKSNKRRRSISRPVDSRKKPEKLKEPIDNLSKAKTDLNGNIMSLDSEFKPIE